MSSESEFRSPEQEVLRLLNECAELRMELRAMNAKIGRMELRLKRAFPQLSSRTSQRKPRPATPKQASISGAEALSEFDRMVQLAASGVPEEAQRILEGKSVSDLLVIAKELGLSFPQNKASTRGMREAILGRIRESLLLRSHNPRN